MCLQEGEENFLVAMIMSHFNPLAVAGHKDKNVVFICVLEAASCIKNKLSAEIRDKLYHQSLVSKTS